MDTGIVEATSNNITDGSAGSLVVGGEKGHIVESIEGNARRLYQNQRLKWKMIPHCTGRYTCRSHELARTVSPARLLQFVQPEQDILSSFCLPSYEFTLPNKDPIVVVPLDDANTTGIISYVKRPQQEQDDGDDCCDYYVHTLNMPSGFRRKLRAMGLTLITIGFGGRRTINHEKNPKGSGGYLGGESSSHSADGPFDLLFLRIKPTHVSRD